MSRTLVPTLARVYQSILQSGSYLPFAYQAHIKLIAKKGKDPSEPNSYKPILLLNLDSKILFKIIANRLAKILQTLIHPAQAGFTQGRSTSSNIRKVLTVLEHARSNINDDIAKISLDTEITFDNVRRKLNLSPWVHKHVPIHENPPFSSTTSHSGLKIWGHQS